MKMQQQVLRYAQDDNLRAGGKGNLQPRSFDCVNRLAINFGQDDRLLNINVQ